MLKISSGILRSVSLRSPTGSQTRPSSERLRQGTFNVLRHFRQPSILESGCVVDLFAGTGAWGIEAMSNGAKQIWFVENHVLALKALHANLDIALSSFEKQSLAAPDVHVLKQDVSAAYERLPETQLMFCDPPYGVGWFEKVLKLEARSSRLASGGVLLYEAGVKEVVPGDAVSQSGLRLFDSKNYGDSTVHFFIKEA